MRAASAHTHTLATALSFAVSFLFFSDRVPFSFFIFFFFSPIFIIHLKYASFIWQAIFWLNYCARIDSNQMERKRHLHISHSVNVFAFFLFLFLIFIFRFNVTSSRSIFFLSPYSLFRASAHFRIMNINIVWIDYVHLWSVYVWLIWSRFPFSFVCQYCYYRFERKSMNILLHYGIRTIVD